MLSAEHYLQELAALAIAAAALFYAVRRVAGWPKKKPPRSAEPVVKLGARLQRGIEKRGRSDCH